MRILTKAVRELKGWDRNPRTISPAALAGLKASIEAFGLVQPIIWNERTNRVVGGHQRLSVLAQTGATETEVVVVDLPEDKEKALNVALNNPEISGVFTSGVVDMLDEIKAENERLYEELLLDALRSDIKVEDPEVVEDDGPGEVPAEPVTKLGDLWELGAHRLICGDSTDPNVVERLMGGERAILMATDPPYGVAYHAEDRPGIDKLALPKWEEIENDDKTGENIQPFLERAFFTAASVALLPNAAWYLWHAQLTQGFFAAAAAAKIVLHRQIIWVKPVLLLGFGDYHWRHELCFYGWVQGNRPPFYGERNQTTIWEIKHETSSGKRIHPTQKPIEIFAIPLRNHTNQGEICYEPFCGSGTQLVAAEQLNRKCYALEISPAYCDVIVNRWEKLTGKKAVNHGQER